MTEDGKLRGKLDEKQIDIGTYQLRLKWTNEDAMRNWENPANGGAKDNANIVLHIDDFALRDSRVDLWCDVNRDLAVTTDDVLLFEGNLPREGRVAKFQAVGDGNMTLYAAGGTIEAVYEGETLFIQPLPEPPLFLPATGSLIVMESTFEITGGSGRFENVDGRLVAQEFVEVGEYGYAAEMTWSFRHAITGFIQFPE